MHMQLWGLPPNTKGTDMSVGGVGAGEKCVELPSTAALQPQVLQKKHGNIPSQSPRKRVCTGLWQSYFLREQTLTTKQKRPAWTWPDLSIELMDGYRLSSLALLLVSLYLPTVNTQQGQLPPFLSVIWCRPWYSLWVTTSHRKSHFLLPCPWCKISWVGLAILEQRLW